jgi:teichuronic acid biosynthesis glycosyltransferase TuaC
MSLRIAVVSTSYPRDEDDPSGHFVRADVRHLEGQGHQVVVMAPPPGGAFGWPGAAARLRQRPLRALEAAAWIARARVSLARMGVDRVVAHWAVPCGWPIGVGAQGELEVVSHGGDVRLLSSLPRGSGGRVVRAIASRATVWRFVSTALLDALLEPLDRTTRARVARIARIEAPRLDLPELGVAIALRRRELDGRRVAVSVGRLVPGKRVDRAIAYVRSRSDLDVLYVVGDGPERARLETAANRQGVDVRFVGAVGRRDALTWIGAADVLIHASRAEGLSTVIREAEALGTPVVRVDQ